MVQNDETQYIARILDGDTECFSAFLDRYSRPLYVLIVQIVGCSEDAEELVQDVFLKAFRCLGSYRGECRFSTWLYRIAYTTAVSATRKKKQEFLYIEENTINNVPDEKADDILYPTDDEERTARLIQAIDLLNVEEKALITLFYYEEKLLFMKRMLNQEKKIEKILSELNKIQNDDSDKKVAHILENVKKELNCLV